jgi:hypothetical protein
MSDKTVAEIIAATFYAICASGGVAFQRHAGMVINEAIKSGTITDKDARSFLTNLAAVAEEAGGPTESRPRTRAAPSGVPGDAR